jgi:hypothetical protein
MGRNDGHGDSLENKGHYHMFRGPGDREGAVRISDALMRSAAVA